MRLIHLKTRFEMKRTTLYIPFAWICLMALTGCKDVIFYPIKGTISGTISDNNGALLSGITVSVSYSEPTQSPGQPPILQTKTIQTDHNGYFRLIDLWDNVLLSIQTPGFLPIVRHIDLQESDDVTLDLELSGSPTVVSISLDKTTLSTGFADTVLFDLEVRDAYNQSNQPIAYAANVLLLDAGQATVAIVSADLRKQGLEHFLFEGMIHSDLLPGAGNYSLVAEVKDPDGHVHRVNTGQFLQAQ